MRYHYEKPEQFHSFYGERYFCNHPVYDCCTLFRVNERGLAVIQQRFDILNKSTYWTEIDEWLADELYLNPRFMDYFNKHADVCHNRMYPTVTIRQIMWGLKLKPMKKEVWETAFDHAPI